MPVKKKRSTRKLASKKNTTKKTETKPLLTTANLQKEILKSQDKLGKTYAKFLEQFKKQRDRFRIKIKQAKEKFSSAKTSYRKSTIKTMIKALEEKKKELSIQLDQVSIEYKKFLAQQKAIQKFEKDYDKKLKTTRKSKTQKHSRKINASKTEGSDTLSENTTSTE